MALLQVAVMQAFGDFLKSLKSQLMQVATEFRTLPSVDEGLATHLGQLYVTDPTANTDYEKVILQGQHVCC